jgi:REP element-mobilizing transposase RayT
MTEDNKNNRRSIRLTGYDYAQVGGYFVTTCAAKKRCAFGKIQNNEVLLNPYGRMVRDSWLSLTEHYSQVDLDEFVVMPNHFHGILMINTTVGAKSSLLENVGESPGNGAGKPRPYKVTLGQMIGYFKYQTTKYINDYRAARHLSPAVVWQRNYYERIIRDEKELDGIRRYIIENPLNWAEDTENPA